MKNIVTLFENHAQLHPGATAVVLEEQQWSYAQLNNYANYIATILLQNGVTENSVVAVVGEKSLEMIAGILAILKLNCSYMPIDSSLPSERIAIMLKNSNTIVSLSKHGYQLNDSHILHLQLDYTAFNATTQYDNHNYVITTEQPAYVMHTSGSTGTPKGVIVPHRGVVRLLQNTNYIHINSTDSILFHSNTSFDAGIFEIWAALINGAQIVISPHHIGDIPAIYKLCIEKNISIILLATGLFHIFSNLDLEKLTTLRYLVVGGDVMHSSAAIRALQKNKTMKIINGYGPAENCVFTTCLVIENENNIQTPVSIGCAITETEVYLLDENQQPVPPGEIGELYTSGLGVALGYINAPELTAEKFISLPHIKENTLFYRTGDMVKQLHNGNYEFIGRCDKQIKIRGFRVELTEIENTISALEFVEEVCLCTIGSENKQLIAFIKIATNSQQYDEITVINYLKSKLPSYCIPSAIEVSDSFPLTSNGKINRKALQESLSEKYRSQTKLYDEVT